MERWWNGPDRGKPKYSYKNLSHCCEGQKAEFLNNTAGGVKVKVDFKR
jgi:hypothetical protein